MCPREWIETRSDATAGGRKQKVPSELWPWPSLPTEPAPALGRTRCGEGPGARAVALVKRLVN